MFPSALLLNNIGSCQASMNVCRAEAVSTSCSGPLDAAGAEISGDLGWLNTSFPGTKNSDVDSSEGIFLSDLSDKDNGRPPTRSSPTVSTVARAQHGSDTNDDACAEADQRAWFAYASALISAPSVQGRLHALLVRNSQDDCIMLQKQLKHGSNEDRVAVLSAMAPLAVPLATDMYGHYLVQRALRYEITFAQHLRGSVVPLALSEAGADVLIHVLESSDESQQRAVVDELLSSQLDETLLSKTALRVWQKVLAIRWTETSVPVRIRISVCATFRGRWAESISDETGSVLGQHLFDAAIVGDGDTCIAEVAARIRECACSSAGVAFVVYLMEHAGPATRDALSTKLLEHATPISLSPNGAKAVQCALRTCGEAFHEAYTTALCTSLHTRATSPARPLLVELAAAQHGLPILTLVRCESTYKVNAAADWGQCDTACCYCRHDTQAQHIS